MRNVKVTGALLAAAALLLASQTARAELTTGELGKEDPTTRKVQPQRRNGLVVGLSGGFALAGSSGYPNNARLLDNPDYYSSTPLMAGYSMSYFAMGALADWISLGPVVTHATFESDSWKSTGWGAGFRIEVFPLMEFVPKLADLSLYTQLGVGHADLQAKGPYPSSDGTQSLFTIGLHHEWRLTKLLGGHAAAGPSIEYSIIDATAIERHWATVGLRVVWYGGGVALDR